MKLQDVVIIGAGGCGRDTLDVFNAINEEKPAYNVLGFLVDPRYGKAGTMVNDKPILGGIDWLAGREKEVKVICGVGLPKERIKLVKRAEKLGAAFCGVAHPRAILARGVTMGTGSIVTAGCVLSNRVRIGNHAHINLDCTIGHDSVMRDFATLAPGVHISGNVIMKEGCYIGIGASVIEKKEIGPWSVIGAGCAVIKDVPEDATVVGVPGKVIKIGTHEWRTKL